MNITLADLREANIARQDEWCPNQKPDLSFRGNELAGESGEACNQIKKLERARHGWRGSKGSVSQLAEELADTVICADLVAVTAGIDLQAAVVAKFNATSEQNGLTTRLTAWRTINSAPRNTDVMVWWPIVRLDENGDPTDKIVGGSAIISELQGDYWLEPDVMNAIGDHMGDDETYAAHPSHWISLPVGPIDVGEDEERCTVCDVPFEDGGLVYWDASDAGHLHAECCGPERESYVNADGSPLADGEPIPEPFHWKAESKG